MKIIGYTRVSTAKQERSGLGLEAQEEAIRSYVERMGARRIYTFTETESGHHRHRPQLRKALERAKATGATLVIAKLDRLSRNAAFLLTLKESGVKFVAADIPDANELTVGVLALVAQEERRAIAQRTSAALQALKRRGKKLGNPNGAAALRRAGKGNTAGLKAIKAKADNHAAQLAPIVADLNEEGITTLGALADALNERDILTPRGGQWHKSSVRNLLDRLEALPAASR